MLTYSATTLAEYIAYETTRQKKYLSRLQIQEALVLAQATRFKDKTPALFNDTISFVEPFRMINAVNKRFELWAENPITSYDPPTRFIDYRDMVLLQTCAEFVWLRKTYDVYNAMREIAKQKGEIVGSTLDGNIEKTPLQYNTILAMYDLIRIND